MCRLSGAGGEEGGACAGGGDVPILERERKRNDKAIGGDNFFLFPLVLLCWADKFPPPAVRVFFHAD